MDITEIDFDSLRNDLIDYYGTAIPINNVATMEVINIENASDIELLHLINNTPLNICDYIRKDLSR